MRDGIDAAECAARDEPTQTNLLGFNGALKTVKRRAAIASAVVEQRAAETPQKLFLPGFDIGAFPNHLNRSSLIAPVARGQRKFHRRAVMVTRMDCVMEYTGEQLDEADGDLIMALMAFAQPYPLGVRVSLNRAKLLRKIGRGTGKSQYDWLYQAMKRLREGTLFLEALKPDGSTRYKVGKLRSFSILDKLDYDEGSAAYYTYAIDPRWATLYSNREYSLPDWDKRMQIGRGQDMAKSLQRLISTSSDVVQRHSLDYLKRRAQYASPTRKFRQTLEAACKELERVEIIAAHKIEENAKGHPQLVLWLPSSA